MKCSDYVSSDALLPDKNIIPVIFTDNTVEACL